MMGLFASMAALVSCTASQRAAVSECRASAALTEWSWKRWTLSRMQLGQPHSGSYPIQFAMKAPGGELTKRE